MSPQLADGVPTGSVIAVSWEGGRCPGLQSTLLRQGFVEAPNVLRGPFIPVVSACH